MAERQPRVGIIDVGTNSALLLIAMWDAGRLNTVSDLSAVIRLGEGVDGSGCVTAAALDRLRTALAHYAAVARSERVDDIVVVGTSASRDADNRTDLCRMCRDITGVDYNILSGGEEAELSFAGAILDSSNPVSRTNVVIDVGGGSTELISGTTTDGKTIQIRDSISLNIGSVRVRERELHTDRPTKRELGHARAWIASEFSRLGTCFNASELIGASGTARILWTLHATRAGLVRKQNVDTVMTMEEVAAWSDRLLSMTGTQVLSLDTALLSGREDVFGAGVMILRQGMSQTGARQLRISPTGLRHGVALRYFGKV